MNYEDVIRQCRLKKATSNICNRQEFWQWWLNEKYNLNLDDEDFEEPPDYKYLAGKSNAILKEMKEAGGKVFTLRSFEYILLYMPISFLHDSLNHYEPRASFQDARGIIGNSDEDPDFERPSFTVDFDFIQGENMKPGAGSHWLSSHQMTDIGKRNYQKILKKLLVPTTYISPDGKLKTIDYDHDVMGFAITRSSKLTRNFGKSIGEIVNELSDVYYYRYFAEL